LGIQSPDLGLFLFMNLQAIIGIKGSQNQQFTVDGKRIPSTTVFTQTLCIVGTKTVEKDGYNAIQFGIGIRRLNTLTKQEQGHIKKAGMGESPPRFLREIRIEGATSDDMKNMVPGTPVKASEVFQSGDIVAVTGVTKGKGFAGVVKRHHFKGGPRTHGQSDRERSPGSIGMTTTPGRVFKGKRMAGRMGGDKVTVQNLKVVAVDNEKNTITISGLVPGGKNGVLVIQKTRMKK
jgi:large subunit ribosomal protein L3